VLRILVAIGLLGSIAACGGDAPSSEPTQRDSGYTVVAEGFDGPTQIADGPGGVLLVHDPHPTSSRRTPISGGVSRA